MHATQELLAAVLDGTISVVSSDHSPAPPSMKQLDTGNFMAAWGGISGGARVHAGDVLMVMY